MTSLFSFSTEDLALLERREKLESYVKRTFSKVYDFGIGDAKEETPLFIREALHVEAVSQYPSFHGSGDLKKASYQWIERRFGVSLGSFEHIISTNGSKEGLFHIPGVLLNLDGKKKGFVIPVPAYPTYEKSVLFHGGVPLYYLLEENKDGFCFNPERFEGPVEEVRALWINSPHNPTGATLTFEDMEKIYAWCLKHDIILLSDECYVDCYTSLKPHSFLQIAKEKGFKNLLCFFSLSKRSRMTGYRSGFVTGDPKLVETYRTYRSFMGVGTPSFIQKCAIEAWKDDHHVTLLNKVNEEKRKLVLDFLEKHKISYYDDKVGGIYIYIKVPPSYPTSFDFYEAVARQTGILFSPGESFDRRCQSHVRIALCPVLQDIKEALHLFQTKIESQEIVL
jgi:LL-diaminopimelate aminotransferase